MMRRAVSLFFKLVIFGLLILGIVAAVRYMKSAHEAQTVAYRSVQVQRGNIEATIITPGIVNPDNRLEIKPPIAGRVEEVLYDEGANVKKGDILAWMSSTERAALLDAARTQGSAELKKWEEYYKPTAIISPITGTIIKRNVEPGQTFSASDSVFSMSDKLIVKAQVDETDIAQVKLGHRTKVTLDAYPDQVIDGKVLKIAFDATTVNNVTTYEVDILPDTVPDYMRSGMTANVIFPINSKDNVLLVPNEALKRRANQAYVLTPGKGPEKKPRETDIQTGIDDGRFSEVTSGLKEGDTVLIATAPDTTSARGTNPFSPFGGRRGH